MIHHVPRDRYFSPGRIFAILIEGAWVGIVAGLVFGLVVRC